MQVRMYFELKENFTNAIQYNIWQICCTHILPFSAMNDFAAVSLYDKLSQFLSFSQSICLKFSLTCIRKEHLVSGMTKAPRSPNFIPLAALWIYQGAVKLTDATISTTKCQYNLCTARRCSCFLEFTVLMPLQTQCWWALHPTFIHLTFSICHLKTLISIALLSTAVPVSTVLWVKAAVDESPRTANTDDTVLLKQSASLARSGLAKVVILICAAFSSPPHHGSAAPRPRGGRITWNPA